MWIGGFVGGAMRSDVFYGSDAGIRLQVFGYLGFVVESSCRKLAWDRHAVEYRETTIITTHNNSEGLGFCCHDEKCGVRGAGYKLGFWTQCYIIQYEALL
jgi:hypothetical protein